MEIKKNPKADLGNLSIIFFQIGLILILSTTYIGLEWKTYERSDSDLLQVEMPDEFQENVPITQLNTPPPPPPPPPPAAPEVVEVIEDEVDIEEDLIQSTESSQDQKMEKIIPVSDVVEEEEEEEIEDVPFTVVENVPIFPGCENVKGRDEQKKCMAERIDAIVKRHFDTEIGAQMGLTGFNRIFVVFKINENGDVVDIQSRGPHKKLEEEAERVVKLLPKMIPGRQRDRPVAVVYSLPIMFEVRQRN